MLSSNKSVGIIGCGLIADTHVEAIKSAVPDCTISVCDPMPGKSELLKKKYNLKASYSTLEEMILKEKPFSVHILSPPQLHVAHTLKSLKLGSNVLVEKPLTFCSNDIKKLYNAAQSYNKVLCVDHSMLYQSSISKMIKMIRSNEDEKIIYINSFFSLDTNVLDFSKLPDDHWKSKLPGGTFIDTVIHPITIAAELVGKIEITEVNFCRSGKYPTELFILWKGNNAHGNILISSQAKPFRRFTEITTNKDTYFVDHSTETLVTYSHGFGPKAIQKALRNFGFSYQLSFGTILAAFGVIRGNLKENPGARGLIKAFYCHLQNNGPLPISEDNVRNSTKALEAIVNQLSNSDNVGEGNIIKIKDRNQIADNDAKSITTLVTGGSGFLGSTICDVLSKKNRKIIAQVRRGANSDKLNSKNVKKIFEDFSYEDVDYNKLVDNVDEVIHCAHSFSANSWHQFKKLNVDSAIALYDAAKRAGCKKFIFISSIAVYGVHHKGHFSANEKTPTINGNSKWDYYIRSKILTEKLLKEMANKGGPKLLIIRPGILYSADGVGLMKKSIPFRKHRLVILFGNGKNHLPFTRVDRVAETVCRTLDFEAFPEGIFNLVGNPKENVKDFIYKRMKSNGVECRFFPVPARLLRFTAFLMEMIYLLTLRKNPPKVTRYSVDSGVRDVSYDCSKATMGLGWDIDKAIEP